MMLRIPPVMNILVFNRQKDLKISKQSVRQVVEAVSVCQEISFTEVALYFVSERAISNLHEEFFHDPTPTDCITFPNEEGGEIFICPRTALLYAQKHSLDPYQETTLYVVHGLLHLLGYDDISPEDRRTMRKKEKTCMTHLKGLNKALRSP